MRLDQYLVDKSISEFADAIDVSHVTVWRYLKRQRVPNQDVMLKIHKATNGQVTPNDFLNIPHSPQNSNNLGEI